MASSDPPRFCVGRGLLGLGQANAATNAEALLKMLLNNTEQLIHAEHPCA